MSNRVEGHILPGTYTPFAGMNVRRLRVGRAEACAVGGRQGITHRLVAL